MGPTRHHLLPPSSSSQPASAPLHPSPAALCAPSPGVTWRGEDTRGARQRPAKRRRWHPYCSPSLSALQSPAAPPSSCRPQHRHLLSPVAAPPLHGVRSHPAAVSPALARSSLRVRAPPPPRRGAAVDLTYPTTDFGPWSSPRRPAASMAGMREREGQEGGSARDGREGAGGDSERGRPGIDAEGGEQYPEPNREETRMAMLLDNDFHLYREADSDAELFSSSVGDAHDRRRALSG